MHDLTLTKISLIISLLGILILLFISNNLEPISKNIDQITDLDINQKVKIKGEVIKIDYKDTINILTIRDKTGKIQIILDKKLNIKKNDSIIVFGRITEYKDNVQISADKIILSSLH